MLILLITASQDVRQALGLVELGVHPYHGGAEGFSSVWTAIHSLNFILRPWKFFFNFIACFLICNTTVVTLCIFLLL